MRWGHSGNAYGPLSAAIKAPFLRSGDGLFAFPYDEGLKIASAKADQSFAAMPEFYTASAKAVSAPPLAAKTATVAVTPDVLATVTAPDRLDALLAPHVFQPGEVPRVDVPITSETPAAAIAADALFAKPATDSLAAPVHQAFADIAQQDLPAGVIAGTPGFEPLPPPPVIG